MGHINIIDTGYLTSAREGTPNSGTNKDSLATYRCNGGSAITLTCGPIRRRSGLNVSDDPNPNSNDLANLHFVSFNNAIYEIDHFVDCTNETERALLKEILLLERTSGIKLLYDSDTAAVTKTLPEIIGKTNTKFNGNEVGGGIPVLVGRVIGTSVNNLPTSRKYAINVTITFEEEKVVIA